MAVSRRVITPLIVACALFMQNLDSTALATALPDIARSLHETPLRLHLSITVFMLALAAFLPVSGWLADRYGSRTIFCLAVATFTLSSLGCGLADDLDALLVARAAQGAGGALMVPVGRLILVRSVPKSELIAAMALMGMPALIGPDSWGRCCRASSSPSPRGAGFSGSTCRSACSAIVARRSYYIEDVREPSVKAFDWLGFILSGFGLCGGAVRP